MTETYLPPTISNELGRLANDAATDRNMYARGTQSSVLSDIDGIPISKLVEKFDSPLFVFSEREIRIKAQRMRAAFESRYPKTQFAWSYKTNYLNAICQIFHKNGWIAEVVSDFEYLKARNLGVAGQDIIFNGPYKPQAILEKAIHDGALIQIDNWDEFSRIEEIINKSDKVVNIGIRIWLDAEIRPIWSKFGFALANGEAQRVAEHIIANPKLNLHTLHTHIGTYILAPYAYKVAIQKLLALREHLFTKHKHLIECINLGGGFPSYSLLHGMVGPAKHTIEPIESYAEAITEVLNKLPKKMQPLLRFESGRHLIDEAGYLLTKVVALKGLGRPIAASSDLSALAHKEQLVLGEYTKTSYIIDAGVNLLYTSTWFQIEAYPAHMSSTTPAPSRLYGPLCMTIDIIRDNINLPQLEVDDIITLHPVGAYNISQSMQFITYRPAVVLINEQGVAEIIKDAETLKDIEQGEHIPEHLQKKVANM
jgi:diaminopimelate decarboxylase